MPSALDISLLGGFEFRVGEQRLLDKDIPGRKGPALFKLVALSRDQQLLRDQAVDALWPDLPQDKSNAQLYKAVHQLRKVLAKHGPEGAEQWLTSNRDAIGLQPPDGVSTDVERFEKRSRQALQGRQPGDLEQAAALYRGDLLPMDLYADWAELPREQLRQLYLDLLLALGESRHQRGDLSGAAQTWRLVLERAPTTEAAHRGLMAIFAAQGQRDRALRQYGLCMDALADEFGVSPSAPTRDLYQSIEQQQPASDDHSSTAATIHLQTSTRQLAAPTSPLIGRSEQCQQLDTALAALATGNNSTLLICGAAGIGKTRLVQELLARAEARGYASYSASAYELEGSAAYAPVVQIIQQALRDSPEAGERLPAEIAALMPQTLQIDDTQPVPNSDPRAAQTYLFAGIASFLRQRSEQRPLLLVVENTHLADRDTLMLLRALHEQLQGAAVLLAITARSETGSSDTEARTRQFLHSLQANGGELIALAGLPPAQQHQLLQQQLASVSRQQSDHIYQLSQGNPLYALELHGTAANNDNSNDDSSSDRPLPPSLLAAVSDRIAELPTAAQQLLTLAAALGEGFDYSLLELLWQQQDAVGSESLLDLLDQLLNAQLLEERGINLHFRHALYRQGIYQNASAIRRRALHARIARQLVQLGEQQQQLPVEQIAYHYRAAGDARQAAHFLMQAGQRAAALYAHQDALQRYQEALELLQEPAQQAHDSVLTRICGQLHTLIGDTWRASGHLGNAQAAYQQAMTLIEALPLNNADRVDLHCKLALVSIFTTDMDQAGLQLALAWGCAPDNTALHARLHILRALYLWHFNRLEEAAEYAKRALTLAEQSNASLETAQACEILAMAYLPLGRWQEGLEYEKRRLKHGRWSPDLVVATDAHLCLWEYHVHDDNMLDNASSFMQQVASEADRLGDQRCVAICHYALGTIHLWQGDSDSALNDLDQSLQLHQQVGSPAGIAYGLSRRAVLHTLSNAIDLGWQSVQKGIAEAHKASIRDHCLQRLYGVGIWNRLQAGDQAQVEELVQLSEQLLQDEGPCTACSLDLYPWLALYHLQRDAIEQADDCTRRLADLVSKTGNPVGQTFAAILNCGIAKARGQHDQARQAREQAIALMEKSISRGSASPMTWLFDRLAG